MLQYFVHHGLLEGVEGVKTIDIEAYHSKADALVITEMCFFIDKLTLFKFGFVKFSSLSALAALPATLLEEPRQIAR